MTSSDDERERRESLAASLNSTIQLAIKYFNNFYHKKFPILLQLGSFEVVKCQATADTVLHSS